MNKIQRNLFLRSQSRGNTKINLDKLLRLEKPVICIKRRLGGIGDVFMTTPITKHLKNLIPNCYLIYATDMTYCQGALAEIIKHNPYVDELIPISEINVSKYDYIVDITMSGLSKERSGTIPPNRIDLFADELGISVESDPTPIYVVEEQERELARKEIEQNYLNGNKREDVKIIIIQAKSNDSRRTWPMEHVQTLANKLSESIFNRVLLYDWGNTCEKWIGNERLWILKDKLLQETMPMIEQSDLVICPDSSFLHGAGALDKSTVTIFGPIPPESRINHYPYTSVVSLRLHCSPCWYSPKCLKTVKKMECLEKITPEMVYPEVVKRLSEERLIDNKEKLVVNKKERDILVKRSTQGIGDLLMATQGIEALKRKFPTKKIHVMASKNVSFVLENNPSVDKIINLEDEKINLQNYFMTFDISAPCSRYEVERLNEGKLVEKNRVEIYAEAMGVRNLITSLTPKYYITKEEEIFAKKFVSRLEKKKIAISLKSAEIYRDWPEEHKRTLCSLLLEKYDVIIFNKNRQDCFPCSLQATNLPFRSSAAIVKECDLLVTVDTSFLHLGAAFDLKTIALFGPIDYRARCKGYKNVTVVTSNECDSMPCWRNANIYCKKTKKVGGYSECLTKIKPKDIYNIVNTLMEFK